MAHNTDTDTDRVISGSLYVIKAAHFLDLFIVARPGSNLHRCWDASGQDPKVLPIVCPEDLGALKVAVLEYYGIQGLDRFGPLDPQVIVNATIEAV